MRVVLMCVALVGGVVFAIWLDRIWAGQSPDETNRPTTEHPIAEHKTREHKSSALAPAESTPTLKDLANGKLPIIDLGWPLNAKSAYWPGENYRPFELHTLATLEKDGVLSKAFSTPEHLGTHLDAPNHFEPNRPSVDQIPPEALFAPGVVIDVTGPVSADSDYMVSLEDVKKFETAHGRIPDGAVVLAHTGWSMYWSNPTRYQNRDVRNRLHFPGYSPEAVEFLIHERNVRGVGIDTLSVDPGLSRDFPVHHLLGKADRYGLENVAHLDKLPPRGFYLFVAPLKIETGSGSPIRLLAVLPTADDES